VKVTGDKGLYYDVTSIKVEIYLLLHKKFMLNTEEAST